MKQLIKVTNAMCRVGRRDVLSIPSFSINQGEQWCLFGGNGAGKSLFASLLKGELRESNNYVTYRDGFSAHSDIFVVSFEEQQRLWRKDDRLDISEYSDDASDKGTLVSSLIESGGIESGLNDSAPNTQLLQQLLDDLDLHSVYDKGIRFLSSGQVRKVLLARALYSGGSVGDRKRKRERESLLILDDPLESIDKDSQKRIANVILQWMQGGNSTLLLCRRQHDVLPAITHMAVLQDLTIIEQGPIESIIKGQAYQSIVNKALKPIDKLPAVPGEYVLPDLDPDCRLIELQNVSAAYQDQAVLIAVNWAMDSHHHVLVEGPNGCGKSTLLSLIDGENHKAYGQDVYLFGRKRGSGETVWDIKSRFGIVSNELHNKYVKGWRVLDVVVSGFFDSVGLYDNSGASEIDAARQWLSVLGLQDLAKSYYHEVSFGQQRLVLLARAMVKHPTVLILDEPCVGLDDYHRAMILATLNRIAAQTQTRLIYVSHVEGEELACINQRLRFVAAAGGGYRIQVDSEP